MLQVCGTVSGINALPSIDDFLPFKTLLNRSAGFLQKGSSITLEAEVTVKRVRGLRFVAVFLCFVFVCAFLFSYCRSTPAIDFFTPDEPLTDVVLIVEDQKLDVSSQILAVHSSFFKTMFFGNFSEAHSKVIISYSKNL